MGEFEEREQDQRRLTALFDVALSLLALVFLGLFILELAADLETPWDAVVGRGQQAIWAVFVVAFLIELTVAPSKVRYLRGHWLVALSLALPLLRVFRVLHGLRALRTTRALRGLNLARTATTTNRAIRSISNLAEVTKFGYLVLVTVLVTVVAAAAVSFFERGSSETSINTFWDGLWWASTLITTVGGPHDPVTLEGRILAVALRVFGLVVFGYFTARLAVYYLGGHQRGERREQADLAQLRDEIERLAGLVEAQSSDQASRGGERGPR